MPRKCLVDFISSFENYLYFTTVILYEATAKQQITTEFLHVEGINAGSKYLLSALTHVRFFLITFY